jgi:hypothetical protein
LYSSLKCLPLFESSAPPPFALADDFLGFDDFFLVLTGFFCHITKTAKRWVRESTRPQHQNDPSQLMKVLLPMMPAWKVLEQGQGPGQGPLPVLLHRLMLRNPFLVLIEDSSQRRRVDSLPKRCLRLIFCKQTRSRHSPFTRKTLRYFYGEACRKRQGFSSSGFI